jgi:hypothetical protein
METGRTGKSCAAGQLNPPFGWLPPVALQDHETIADGLVPDEV